MFYVDNYDTFIQNQKKYQKSPVFQFAELSVEDYEALEDGLKAIKDYQSILSKAQIKIPCNFVPISVKIFNPNALLDIHFLNSKYKGRCHFCGEKNDTELIFLVDLEIKGEKNVLRMGSVKTEGIAHLVDVVPVCHACKFFYQEGLGGEKNNTIYTFVANSLPSSLFDSNDHFYFKYLMSFLYHKNKKPSINIDILREVANSLIFIGLTCKEISDTIPFAIDASKFIKYIDKRSFDYYTEILRRKSIALHEGPNALEKNN